MHNKVCRFHLDLFISNILYLQTAAGSSPRVRHFEHIFFSHCCEKVARVQVTEVGKVYGRFSSCTISKRRTRFLGCVTRCMCLNLSPANLTGHVERVGIENFELLKVLGTGGQW